MKRLAEQSLYEILDLRPDAPQGEVEAGVERALALYGPGSLAMYTLMSPEDSELLARRIEEARTTLLDPSARARYDEVLGRAGETRAAPRGAAEALGGLPPVIPAVQPSAPRPAAPEPVASAAAEPQVPAPAATPPPIPLARTPAPILLDRPVAAPPPAPARPAATPPPEAAKPPEAPKPPLPVLPDGAPWTGEVLRQVREARGISVQQIAERTRVTRHHIENIEGERFSALPAPVYLRGILLSLARELRLDGQKVARSYLDRAAAAAGAKAR